MGDLDSTLATLKALREMGVGISIDDFGTGYSSLSYLKRFPIGMLKIDQSFVRDVPRDADSAAIVQTIVLLAHSLNMAVIAEGVETAEQQAFLEGLGCDEVQGYHISRPLPVEALTHLLREDQEERRRAF
ncbi:Phytochrome-like protein cph2 [compost metagenome]